MTERPHSDWEVDLLLEDNLRLREQVKAAAAGPSAGPKPLSVR